jgi:hypothetical protein
MAEMHHNVIGQWVHSHEESRGDLITLRPPDYAFPPSRGRRAIRLDAGGIAESQFPGATDKRERAKGTWACSANILKVSTLGFEGSYEIKEASHDRLILRKLS